MRRNHAVSFVAGVLLTASLAGQPLPPSPTQTRSAPADLAAPPPGSLPDLTPYTPAGWDSPVILSNVTGTSTSVVPIPSGATVYLDFALVNGGAATSTTFHHRVFIDDELKGYWYTAGLAASNWAFVADANMGVLADGLHVVRLVIDSENEVVESDEANNVYERWFSVGTSNLVPYQPADWDGKIVLSTVTGTHTEAPIITTADTIYLDFAALNTGPGGAAGTIYFSLYVDGLYRAAWSKVNLAANSYTWAVDYSLASLAAGGHTVRLVVDTTDAIPETNEFDNEYIRTFTVFDTASPVIYVLPTTLTFGSTGSDGTALAPESNDARGPAEDLPLRWLDPQAAERRAAVKEKAEKQGRVRVIVELDAPFVAEGSLENSAITKQRIAIREKQERALQALQIDELGATKFESIPFFAAELDSAQLARLEMLPEVVDFVEDLAASPEMASTNAVVRTPVAWAAGFDGSGQVVAVLDSGVSATHPFFATGTNKIVSEACYSSTTASSVSLCPGGASASTSPGSGTNCPLSVTGCDHGTHVAGSIAGNDWAGPNFGVARGADLVAIQVFSRFVFDADCGGAAPCARSWVSDQIRGLERVLALHGARRIAAVNMSLGVGLYVSISTCESAQPGLAAVVANLRSVGIATVAASGNDGSMGAMSAPACVGSAISVAATTDADQVASFSNVTGWTSLVAPGVDVTSSVPGGGVAAKSGTSMAAPHVAGAWAILKQAHPDWNVSQVITALRDSAISIPDARAGGVVADLRRLDVGSAAVGDAMGFQILNFGGSTLEVAPITLASPAAWVTWTPTSPMTVDPGQSVQVRVKVNLAAAPVGLSVARLLVQSNDVSSSPYPDGVFIVISRDPLPAAPTGLMAHAPVASAVMVTWNGVTGATNYHIYRTANGTTWTMVGATTMTGFLDETVAPSHSYLYKVRAYNMVESGDSNKDLATTTVFTDGSIIGIPVFSLHWSQLLTAVNSVRAMTGLPPAVFTAPAPAAGVTIRRQHLLDLRTALAAARTALALPPITYTDPTITVGVTQVKTSHVLELRGGVQ